MDISTASYADDLIRVEAAQTAAEVEATTLDKTQQLKQSLQPHRLQMNMKKCESLVSVRGKGAYVSARRLYGGAWMGPPLKDSVKYLGAHLQAQPSCKLEVTKRIAAARSAFAMFAKFFRRSTVPHQRKIMVFRAVVNEALLSALEVRVLSQSGLDKLEAARGLLLLRIFGVRGFGKVSTEQVAVSVPISLLRRVCGLAEVATELRVRRLLWLRSSLLAERDGDVRLELAANFGVFPWQATAPINEVGQLTPAAPAFLSILDGDLRALLPSWKGFVAGWKENFLQTAESSIRDMRGTFGDASLPQSLQQPCTRTSREPSRGPRSNRDATRQPSLQIVESPAEVVRSLRVLSDGAIPDADEELTDQQWLAGVYCGHCAHGPFHSTKSFASHVVIKHGVRHRIQTTACPTCGRQFTKTSACRRHVAQLSCNKHVVNHGRAGALAGMRDMFNRQAAETARVDASVTGVGSSHASSASASVLPGSVDGNAVVHGRRARAQPHSCGSTQTAASRREAFRGTRWQRVHGRAGDTVGQAAQSSGEDRRAARQGPPRARSLELPHFLLPKETDLSNALLASMAAWKARIPDKGPHPLGAPRRTVAGTVAQELLKNEEHHERLARFKAFHGKLTSLPDMEQSIQLAMARETRDGHVLLKLRPQALAQAEWTEAVALLTELISQQGGEKKSGAAPPGSLVRQLGAKPESS